MASSEFELIRRYFTRFDKQQDWLAVGIGDDAAVITPPTDQQQLIAIDMLNAGIHFPAQTTAADVGYKALAVNISDIASMGGEPVWFTLALSLPSADEAWLAAFCDGMATLIDEYQLTLIGGDTTHGSLSVTIQITGHIPVGQAITRSGAGIGDDIYVSGQLGAAAAALLMLQNRLATDERNREALLRALNRPVPRVNVGQGLRGIATACIDISDGLAADLGHILERSGVGAEIDRKVIPVSENLRNQQLTSDQLQRLVLSGGDDYELCFTAPAAKRAQIDKLAMTTGVPLTRIGKIVSEAGLYTIEQGNRLPLSCEGYDHFT